MTSDPKSDLQRYLQNAREALLWKLDGLSEYDIRRPMTRTGTNLLGLVKHVASVEAGYFGDTFGRPFPEPLQWIEDDAGTNADLWATASESRDDIVGLYHRVWAHSDATIETLPLDALGQVPWWPVERREVTLHRILIHMTTETCRHAGHADIVRELIDGPSGCGGTSPTCRRSPTSGGCRTGTSLRPSHGRPERSEPGRLFCGRWGRCERSLAG